MDANHGIWAIKTGKGNRMYINCKDDSKIMHPADLSGMNGLGIYGYEHLKELAIAILKFEKVKNYSESILGALDDEPNNYC